MQERENGHGDIITGGNVILMNDTHTSFRALKYTLTGVCMYTYVPRPRCRHRGSTSVCTPANVKCMGGRNTRLQSAHALEI